MDKRSHGMTGPPRLSPMNAELVERLRHMARLLHPGSYDIPALLIEAADALEQSSAELSDKCDAFRRQVASMAGDRVGEPRDPS